MSVYRIHLKPGKDASVSYAELLEFCKRKQIIGVGWADVVGRNSEYYALREECLNAYKNDKGVFKCIRAISGIVPGDYIWTREGDIGTNYYLCKATDLMWKDRIVTKEHRTYDVTNYVGCKWVKIGTEDKVPGRVVNSFRARLSAQHVYNVDEASEIIWNRYCNPEDKSNMPNLTEDMFWSLIGPEELECLVLLYLQTRGFYVYSSTIKKDTKTYEGVLVSHDGKTMCYPQVKQNEHLNPLDYVRGANDKVVLFSSSESYGEQHPWVECLRRQELLDFIKKYYEILPDSIKYWVDFVKMKH